MPALDRGMQGFLTLHEAVDVHGSQWRFLLGEVQSAGYVATERRHRLQRLSRLGRSGVVFSKQASRHRPVVLMNRGTNDIGNHGDQLSVNHAMLMTFFSMEMKLPK